MLSNTQDQIHNFSRKGIETIQKNQTEMVEIRKQQWK